MMKNVRRKASTKKSLKGSGAYRTPRQVPQPTSINKDPRVNEIDLQIEHFRKEIRRLKEERKSVLKEIERENKS